MENKLMTKAIEGYRQNNDIIFEIHKMFGNGGTFDDTAPRVSGIFFEMITEILLGASYKEKAEELHAIWSVVADDETFSIEEAADLLCLGYLKENVNARNKINEYMKKR